MCVRETTKRVRRKHACLAVNYDEDAKTLRIVDLFVPEKFRGHGFALHLLWTEIRKFSNKATYVELDDMSDRFEKKKNLYCAIGFSYLEPGFPEMRARLGTVLKLLKRKIRQKKRRKFAQVF